MNVAPAFNQMQIYYVMQHHYSSMTFKITVGYFDNDQYSTEKWDAQHVEFLE